MVDRFNIEFGGTTTKRDIWRSYYEYYSSFGYLYYAFFGFLLFGITILFLKLGNSFEIRDFLQLLVLSGAFTLLFAASMLVLSVNYSTSEHVDVQYRFSDDQVTFISKKFETYIKWGFFTKAKETSNYFLLAMEDGRKILIPKRHFQFPEQTEDLRELLIAKLEKQAYMTKQKGNLGLK